MKKQLPKLSMLVCAVLLGVLSILNIALPDRAYSEGEKRVLSQFPPFSFGALFSQNGNWTMDFETYFNDQFILRDKWVGLKASMEKLAGKTENDGVYFADDDNLIEKPNKDSASAVNIKSIRSFSERASLPVYVTLVPGSLCVNQSSLPAYAGDGDHETFIKETYAQLDDVQACDVLPALRAHAGEYLYYRTDHHPTSLGAYYIYRSIAETMGIEPLPLESYERRIVSEDFYGTMRAKSGAWWVQADEIELFSLPEESYTLTTFDGAAGENTIEGLYVLDNLSSRDQYTVFLGGNQPRQIVRNAKEAGGRRLLLIKDSFSHCIVPFLAAHYAEIHLLDLRYYRSDVQAYLAENEIDEVLVLYSVENFKTDRNMVFLNK